MLEYFRQRTVIGQGCFLSRPSLLRLPALALTRMGIATAEFGSDASRGKGEVPAILSRVGETDYPAMGAED